uniref:PiggyBac transposable element-derived protein domain-containing protein n=1 Tax=Aplanochytrium stocchinoi TaxID=215587 RepID=A0A7S3UZE6_9STRA|mmetsp:Transcript_15388/g.18179  ORF Transcript_15388/g.18179 Transcript_15388/m.18179 type:complete len:265 (-) Transcript_15388:455-1249(-)
MPNKNNSQGFKVYALVDAVTKIAVRLFIYSGKNWKYHENYVPLVNLDKELSYSAEHVTIYMIQDYINTFRCIHTDRGFSTVPLTISLRENYGLLHIGTARQDLHFFPKMLKPKRKKPLKTDRGNMRFARNVCRKWLGILEFSDSVNIAFISSDVSVKGSEIVRKKRKGGQVKTSPAVRNKYIDFMSGVDDWDQGLSYTEAQVKQARKWWHSLWSFLSLDTMTDLTFTIWKLMVTPYVQEESGITDKRSVLLTLFEIVRGFCNED